VCCEDGGHVGVAMAEQNQRQRRRPAVKMGHHLRRSPHRLLLALGNELGHDVTENGRIAALPIVVGDVNIGSFEQLLF